MPHRIGLVLLAGCIVGLALPLAAAPSNDLFSASGVLSGTNVLAFGTNIDAGKDPGEPDHANDPGGASVWWRWTSPSAGDVLIMTDGSDEDLDTLLAVYTGTSVSGLTEVASNNDHGLDWYSRVRFETISNATYFIAVDGSVANDGSLTGAIALSLDFRQGPFVRPANDLFAHAPAVSGLLFTVVATNTEATREPDEPLHANEYGDTSLWWSWAAPATGSVRLHTRASNFDTILAVYRGDTLAGLSEVASSDDISPFPDPVRTSEVTFEVEKHERFHFAVDGFDGNTGEIVLTLVWEEIAFRVSSDYGTPQPPVGLHTNDWGALLTNTCTAFETHGTTQYVCTGWTLEGATDNLGRSRGSGATMLMAHTNDCSLTWNWRTNYWLATAAGLHGGVGPPSGWQGRESNVVVTASADQHYHFTAWTGSGTNLIAGGDTGAEIITVRMTEPGELAAGFAETLVTNQTPEWWLAEYGFTSNYEAAALGDPDHDGMPTWAEFHADTIPTNGLSVLAFNALNSSGSVIRIEWKGGIDAVQVLQMRKDLLDPAENWTPLFTNQPPTPLITNYLHTPVESAPLFYRLRSWRPGY